MTAASNGKCPPPLQRMSVAEYRSLLATTAGVRPAAARRNKFGNKVTVVDGISFSSAKEAKTWQELSLARSAADSRCRVVDIRRQVPYELTPRQSVQVVGADGALQTRKERAMSYVADFVVTYADGRSEVIDAKSEITRKHPLYVAKRKQMLFALGIAIREV